MANVASVLREEIARVARKEVRSETDNLKKTSARYRSEIAALKRRVTQLEQQLARLERMSSKITPAASAAEVSSRVRFSPKGLRAQREKLGLSAAAMGRLLGVSGQTIYNWEAGNTRPRGEQLAAIGGTRGIGKREANARLAGVE